MYVCPSVLIKIYNFFLFLETQKPTTAAGPGAVAGTIVGTIVGLTIIVIAISITAVVILILMR